MPFLTDVFTLSNGVQIPKIGFGTWQVPDGEPAYDATRAALDAGYRHIDTARAYGNEASVGRAVRDSGIAREDVFVTTKLPAEVKDHDEALRSFEETTAALGFETVDLYLVHAPWPWTEIGKDCREGNRAVWKALEEIHADGRARAIGVSNFSVADLDSVRETAEVTPHVNQIRWFVGHTQAETTAYCRENGILVEGYSPLATGGLVDDEAITTVADRYGRTAAQVALRYLLHKDVLPLPKSTTPARIVENADLDFDLTPQDVATLDALTRE
ncbi:aldo/keto reductase [Kineococcus rhizosphaerae]|uniref:Diketogulonate reductase-like aldo/keto reductase n=1 Tax=Kineococcus rhizosphaerae TaxID=559628 RepID=A0A2T0RAB9_9ACTN|nr:aldo/keto reductase [Kineococcus rhizosphaerae]PRY18118.1 diketogulonate reductase-like aldo/keto reductase [Kineococcus rhizosphaerae]